MSRLGQIQLGAEQFTIRIERVEQCIHPALVSRMSQPGAVVQGRHQQVLLRSNLSLLAVFNERVRDFAECIPNRLLILRQRQLLLSPSKLHVRFQPAGCKNRLRELRREVPGAARACEQVRELVALKSQKPCQADTWKESRLRRAYQSALRFQSRLDGADVGSALKQRGGQSRRHGWRRFLL